ncbi:MAG: diguanylate cyclase [Pelosinus sp.]|nr:diguanylate cyclase [Pelosinus sp.]
MKTFSLRHKILLAVLPVIIISLCTIAFIFYTYVRVTFIDNKLADMEKNAIQHSTTIDMWFNLLAERLQNAARTKQVRQTLSKNEPIANYKDSLLKELHLSAADLIWCEVISPDGYGQRYLLDSPEAYSTIYVDIKHTEYYKKLARGAAAIHIAPTDNLTPSGYPIVAVAAIVPDENGNMTGILSVGIEMSDATYNTMKLYQNEVLPFVLFDTNDNPFFFSKSDLSTAGAGSEIGAAKHAAEDDSPRFTYQWDDSNKLAYTRPMPFTHWSLAVIVDEAELFAPLYTFLQNIFTTAFLFILLTVIVIFFLASWLTKPLTKFEAAISQVSTGDLSLLSIPVHSHDEIGRLARSFEYMVTNLRRISKERDSIQKQIRLSEEKYSKAFRSIPSLIALTSLKDGRYIEVNDAVYTIFGYTREEVIGLTSSQIKLWESEIDREKFTKKIQECGYVRNYMNVHCKKNGDRLRGFLSAEIIEIHDEKCIIACWTDITALKTAEDELRYLGTHDALTGLHNRTYFENKSAELSEEKQNEIGIIMYDLDGLKLINDTLGHAAGDKMLVAAADIIKESAGPNATVARIGGDEFITLLPLSSKEELASICRAVSQKADRHPIIDENIYLSISMGYALSTPSQTNFKKLLAEADDNMYRDKMSRSQHARSAIVQTIMNRLTTRNLMTAPEQHELENLACQLAKDCGLSEQHITEIKLFSQFHDIGTIAISDYILLKPAGLTTEERKDIERHAEIGHRVALSSPNLTTIADWILKHHEWWNGGGYPLGLKGEEIPLECRIIAIIDAYAAMTSHRPYREAMPLAAAIAELRRCAGTQFDPRLVALFIKKLTAKTSL